MKKVLKVLAKAVKWYGIVTVGIWAYVGMARVFDSIDEHPDLTRQEHLDNILDDATEGWKKFIGWLKVGFL